MPRRPCVDPLAAVAVAASGATVVTAAAMTRARAAVRPRLRPVRLNVLTNTPERVAGSCRAACGSPFEPSLDHPCRRATYSGQGCHDPEMDKIADDVSPAPVPAPHLKAADAYPGDVPRPRRRRHRAGPGTPPAAASRDPRSRGSGRAAGQRRCRAVSPARRAGSPANTPKADRT